MTMNILDRTMLHNAILNEKEIIQIFKRDLTGTFFILKDDYLTEKADENSQLSNMLYYVVVRLFDLQAYSQFKEKQNRLFGTEALMDYISRMYEGIKMIESCEEITTTFHSYVESSNKSIKLNPQFFPKGTLVTVSSILSNMRQKDLHPSVYTVSKVIQNDINSFLLETTSPDPSSFAEPDEKYKFNIDHVESIVLRGEKMVVDYTNLNPEILLSNHLTSIDSKARRKGEWAVYSLYALIRSIIGDKLIGKGAVPDVHGLVSVLENQSFVKHITVDRSAFGWMDDFYLVNKKRAKRFVNQNLNRFLLSAKNAQKRHDDEIIDHYYGLIDKDFDKLYPEDKEKEIIDDSSLEGCGAADPVSFEDSRLDQLLDRLIEREQVVKA